MAVRCLDDAVLMGHLPVVAAAVQAVVGTKRLVKGCNVENVNAVTVAAGSQEPIGAEVSAGATTGRQGVLESF